MQMFLGTLENSVKKETQRINGTKQVKENPEMYCSGTNPNKESLVHSCVSDTIYLLVHYLKQIKLKLLTLSSHGN